MPRCSHAAPSARARRGVVAAGTVQTTGPAPGARPGIEQSPAALLYGPGLVIVHGNAEETTRARGIIGGTHAESMDEHELSRTEIPA